MAIEKVIETLPLHELQQKISKFGAANVALAALLTGALVILADYAWMLYLRSKMVECTLPIPVPFYPDSFTSLRVRCPCLLSVTPISFQTISLGSISSI